MLIVESLMALYGVWEIVMGQESENLSSMPVSLIY